MLYEIFITLVAFLFLGFWLRARDHNHNITLQHTRDLVERDSRIASLTRERQEYFDNWTAAEDGVREICENYENDRLDLLDKIEDRDQIIEKHAKHCHNIVEDTFDLVLEKVKKGHVPEQVIKMPLQRYASE